MNRYFFWGGLLILILLFSGYGIYHWGRADERLVWTEWKASVLKQVAEYRRAQLVRMQELQAQVAALESRPEQIRTVIKEVKRYVKADTVCPSLPPDWRRLWNAEPAGGASSAPATAAQVDDAARVDLATAADAVEEARVRFEHNAAALTALQLYVTSVCQPQEDEK